MNEQITQADISCTLNDEEFAERRALVRATILPEIIKQERTTTGLHLLFTDTEVVRTNVEEFIELERQCCGFLTLTVSPKTEPLHLIIDAPVDAQSTLDTLSTVIASHD
ncbi:MAG: hypothetical protein AAF512_05035 [Pseudomonadota bacterium]